MNDSNVMIIMILNEFFLNYYSVTSLDNCQLKMINMAPRQLQFVICVETLNLKKRKELSLTQLLKLPPGTLEINDDFI